MKKLLTILIFIALLATTIGSPVFAATDQFSVTQEVTEENTIAGTGGGGGGGGIVLVLEYLHVSPDINEALVEFGTNIPVSATISWGKTQNYELGSLSDENSSENHSFKLTRLDPSTKYFFKLELVDQFSRLWVISGEHFMTLALADTFPPANISNFLATPTEKEIKLTWNNPRTDFDIVRILKSEKFYPRDPSEGEVIYEGRAEKYTDRDVKHGVTYYYTAFSRDRAGNYSSGAVTDGRLLEPGEVMVKPKLFAGILQLSKELIDPLLRSFSIADIDFIQDGEKLPVVENTVEIRGDRNLTISIDYEKVPEILKTIAVTMFDPENQNKTFSFLLRVNEDKTAFQAEVGALERSGKYAFSLAILDYKHQGLASVAGTIISQIPKFVSGGNGSNGLGGKGLLIPLILLLLILLVVLVIVMVVRRKKNKTIPGMMPGTGFTALPPNIN